MTRVTCLVQFFTYLAVFVINCAVSEVDVRAKYQPTWESLDTRPLPKWYDQAKVGIFLHWGVYSVPTMGTEWFWTNWRNEKVPSYVDYMTKNFKPGFTYQEFASQFTAEHFDPNYWSALFEQSGAKYVVLTSKHHDGYALWPSKYSFSWNSVDVGPHRDIISELATAVRNGTSLKFGLYHSLFEWFNPMYLSDKQKAFSDNQFVTQKVIPEMLELINTYQPDVLWSDGDWEANYNYWNATNFIAWLYNESPVRDTVVTNDRWGIGTLCKHGDFITCSDRFNPGVLQKKKYENAFTIDKKSWGYRANARLEDFMSQEQLIKEIVVTVSTGGNVLVNVGPTQNGLIQPIFVERLLQMGSWLKINGEAIYESRPWTHQNDTKTPDVWYTSKLAKSDRTIVYAIVLKYPFDYGEISLYALGGQTDVAEVRMLGFPGELEWSRSNDAMTIRFPDKSQIDKLGLHSAWTIAINIPRNFSNDLI